MVQAALNGKKLICSIYKSDLNDEIGQVITLVDINKCDFIVLSSRKWFLIALLSIWTVNMASDFAIQNQMITTENLENFIVNLIYLISIAE